MPKPDLTDLISEASGLQASMADQVTPVSNITAKNERLELIQPTDLHSAASTLAAGRLDRPGTSPVPGGPLELSTPDLGTVPGPGTRPAPEVLPEVPQTPETSLGDIVSAIAEETQTAAMVTEYLGQDSEFYTPEGGWTHDDFKAATSDIPEEFHEQVMEAPNPFYERQRILHTMENVEKLSSLGWGKYPAVILGSLLDPATIAIGFATAGIGAGAVATRRAYLTARLTQATAAAGANVAQEAMMQAIRPISDWDSLTYSAIAGASLGFALGPSKAAVMAAETKALANLSNKVADHVALKGTDEIAAADLFGANTAGAARAPTDVALSETTEDFIEAVGPGASGPIGTSGLRFDAAGQTRNSPNPFTSSLGAQLGVDAVGNRDLSSVGQTFVASEKQALLERQMIVPWAQGLREATTDFFKRSGISQIDLLGRQAAVTDLYDQAFNYIIGAAGKAEVDPAALKIASNFQTRMREMFEVAKDPSGFLGRDARPIDGFAETLDTGRYVPFMHDFRKWHNAASAAQYGEEAMQNFVANAMRKAMPELEEKVIARAAKGYLRTLARVDAGMDINVGRALKGEDMDRLAELLKSEGVDERTVKDMVEYLTPKTEKAATNRAKRRTPLDPLHTERLYNHGTGKWDTVSFHDFLHKDMDMLMRSYTKSFSGVVGLHGVMVKSKLGDVLVDGLATRADLEKALEKIRETGSTINRRGVPLTPEQIERDVANIEYLWNAVRGVPVEGSNSTAMAALNTFKNFNFFRLMGMLGFAQLAESAPIVYNMGVKSALANMPILRKLRMDLLSSKIDEAQAKEMLEVFGFGGENLRHNSVHALDEFGTLDGSFGNMNEWEGFWRKASRTSSRMAQGVNTLSLAPVVTNAMQRWAGRAVYFNVDRWIRGVEKPDEQLLRFMGIDDAMWSRIKSQQKYFTRGQNGGVLFNFEKWDDFGARATLQSGVLRMGRKMVQENDVGMMNRLSRKHPIMFKMMLQFRTFMLGAWSNHTLHQVNRSLNMGPVGGAWHIFSAIQVGILAAAPGYMLRTYLQSIGRSDREEFLKERLSPNAIAKASFQNSSISSFAPALVDSLALSGLYDPVFAYRSTGLASDPIMGSPTGGLLNDSIRSVRSVVSAVKGDDEFSQRDARRLGSLVLPNLLPVTALMNATISGLPEKDRQNR